MRPKCDSGLTSGWGKMYYLFQIDKFIKKMGAWEGKIGDNTGYLPGMVNSLETFTFSRLRN